MGESEIEYIDCRLVILDETRIEYSDHYNLKALGTVSKDPLIRKTIERFVHFIDKYGNPYDDGGCKGEDLEVLGQHLYNLLFTDKREIHPDTNQETSVRYCFLTAYQNFEKARKNNERLRLRVILNFHQKADELAGLPWEFIRVPWEPQGFFLAGKKTELILTRCVPEAEVGETLDPGERPLKILIARSAPPGIDSVEANDAVQYILSLNKPGIVEVDKLENPSLSDIKSRLEKRPHIFHFIGHGRASLHEPPAVALFRERKDIDRDEENLTAKQKRDGVSVDKVAWVESTTFAELFKEHPPRLVFLHACKGAASGYKFHNTARDLIKAKVPAVVAMQFEITNEDANTFAQKFYQNIDAGLSVDEAVSEGRWELGSPQGRRGAWNDRGFGTPVIYLQAKGPLISPRLHDPSSGEKRDDDTAGLARQRCPYACKRGWIAIPLDVNFCWDCKQPLAACPNCKRIITPGFCNKCGEVKEGGTSAVTAAPQVAVSDSQLQPGTPSNRDPLQPPPESAKPNQVDIRAGRIQ
jgi:hypothetical protein